MTISGWASGAAAALVVCLASPSWADGPYYGYSGYFGGPAVYYTRDLDVQQTTRPVGGEFGFGVRTYTTGGPFFRYKPRHARGFPVRRHREVLRVRG